MGLFDAGMKESNKFFTMLVENARKHGGPDVVVRLEAFTEGQNTGFRVRDTGQGISPANLDRVFDRFFTTDRARLAPTAGRPLRRAAERSIGSAPAHSPSIAPTGWRQSARGNNRANSARRHTTEPS